MHPVILKQKSSSKSGFLVGKGWQTIRIFFLYQTARNSITLDVNVDVILSHQNILGTKLGPSLACTFYKGVVWKEGQCFLMYRASHIHAVKFIYTCSNLKVAAHSMTYPFFDISSISINIIALLIIYSCISRLFIYKSFKVLEKRMF